jgi:hypothetical protein
MLGGMRKFGWFWIFYGIFSLSASSQTMIDVRGLTDWAIKLTGYPEPESLPVVHTVSIAELEHMTGRASPGGAYLGGRVVYVSESEPPKEQDAIVMHEIVHFLQAQAGKHSSELRCSREVEANRAEWSYRAIVLGEHSDFRFNWEWYQCKQSDLRF